MKVTFPHMGLMYVPVRGLLQRVGLEVIVPPMSSKKTLSIGTQHSPEYACLPLKVNIGNFIEAYEMGADTIVMAGGVGPCRFGYYAQLQREILGDLGMNYQMIVLEPPDAHPAELINKIKVLSNSWWDVASGMYLAFAKANAIDQLEKILQKNRPREKAKGISDQIFEESVKQIDLVMTRKEVYSIAEKYSKALQQVELDQSLLVPKIAIVGEIYTVLEPFVNFNIEKMLGSLGIEVTRSIYLSQWINDHLFLGLLPADSSRKTLKLSKPYLNSFVGGHGRETVASTVDYGRKMYDGVIQLAPLTCMPEIVAHSVLPQISKKYDLPIMSLYLDEQSGEAGIRTRVEAFVDLITRKGGDKRDEMLFGN